MFILATFILTGLVLARYVAPAGTGTSNGSSCGSQDWDPCGPLHTLYKVDGQANCLSIRSNTVGLTYEQADYTCGISNSTLPEIHNKETQKFYEVVLKRPEFNNGHSYWLNLVYHHEDGIYVWGAAGTKLTYSSWHRSVHGPKTNEHCVRIDPDTGFWYSASCSDHLFFLCEAKPNSSASEFLPTKPKVNPSFKYSFHNQLRAGDEMSAECFSLVPPGFQFVWKFEKGASYDIYTRSHPGVIFETSYTYKDNTCRRQIKSGINVLAVGGEHNSWSIHCIVMHKNYVSIGCNTTDVLCDSFDLEIINVAHVPKIKVDYHWGNQTVYRGHPLRAYCLPCSPVDAFAFFIKMGQQSIHIDENDPRLKTIHMEEDETACSNQQGLQKAVIIFRIDANATSLELRCQVKVANSKGEYVDFVFSTASRVLAIDGPERPQLNVTYHKDPYIIFYGRSVYVNCSACLGSTGNLQWLLADNDYNFLPAIELQIVEISSTLQIDRNVSQRCVEFATASLEMEARDSLDGNHIACASELSNKIGAPNLVAYSEPFTVEFLGNEPLDKADWALLILPFMSLLTLIVFMLLVCWTYTGVKDFLEKDKEIVKSHHRLVIERRRRRRTVLMHLRHAHERLENEIVLKRKSSTCVDTGLSKSRRLSRHVRAKYKQAEEMLGDIDGHQQRKRVPGKQSKYRKRRKGQNVRRKQKENRGMRSRRTSDQHISKARRTPHFSLESQQQQKKPQQQQQKQQQQQQEKKEQFPIFSAPFRYFQNISSDMYNAWYVVNPTKAVQFNEVSGAKSSQDFLHQESSMISLPGQQELFTQERAHEHDKSSHHSNNESTFSTNA